MQYSNPKVDFFFDKESVWQEAYGLLRQIVLETGLQEELKWGCPCYTHQDTNVVLIHGFKEYCAILFMKGALLRDAEGLMIQQTENVQAGRQMRFVSTSEIASRRDVIKANIFEAIELEKAGIKVPLKKTAEYVVPPEFQARLDADPTLNAAYQALTPGRQRGYLYYFAQPKLPKTREARIDKYIPQIRAGKGVDD